MTTPHNLDPNAFLMGGGIPAAQFPTIGTSVGGTITQPPKVEQQKDLDTGEPKFWADGKPMMQLIVTVQTDLRDPQIVDDDGQRVFYIKANSLKAVREAVRRAGAKGLEVGGTLTLTYTADGEAKKRGYNPPKIYSATYTPPSAVAANEFLNGASAPAAPPVAAAPVPAAPYAQPAAAPVQQAAPVAPAAPAAGAPGLDPAVAAAIANLSPEQRAALGLPS